MDRSWRGCCATLLLSIAASAVADQPPVDAAWLAAELRKGGYLVYFRHTSTYRDAVEMEARNAKSGRLTIEDCSTQRNLNGTCCAPRDFWGEGGPPAE